MLGAYLFIAELYKTTLIFNADAWWVGAASKTHAKGSQTQDTQVKIQFSFLHLLGLSKLKATL